MAKSLPRPQRTCIFCGGKGLTREHAFADWLRPYLRSAQPEHYFGDHDVLPSGGTASSIKKWSGDPHSRRLRVVCRTCNEGWMSKLQQAAKPYLLPLVEGRSCVLGETAQSILAAWGAMSVMVSEHFARPSKRAISKEERQHLWLHGTPPETFKIWIGHYARLYWRGRWFYTSAGIADSEAELTKSSTDGMPIPNTQTTTYIIGQLYFHVLSSPVTVLVKNTELDPQYFVRIFPPGRGNSMVAWPPPSLSDSAAYAVAHAIFSELDRISRLAGH